MNPISQTWPSSSPQSQAQWSRELREPAVEGVTAASTLPGAGAVGFQRATEGRAGAGQNRTTLPWSTFLRGRKG